MVKFTTEELQRIMYKRHNIRNISVIAQASHGKSTLSDSFAASAGVIAQEGAGTVCMLDTRSDEQERGFSFKSTGISLYYNLSTEFLKDFNGEREGNGYLINLIDTPGRADFSAEVTAGLRASDGALVVVDCVDGVSFQTETVIRQALGEFVRPILTINKLDRCFLELQLDGEVAYQTFQKIIENVNVTVSTYEDPLPCEVMVNPQKGTVSFAAGIHGWAFTLTNFAKLYASKFGVDQSKMMQRLWGENYFDRATRKWTTKRTGSPTCKRGFVQLVYDPIKQAIEACVNNQKNELWTMLHKLGVTMNNDEKKLTGKALMKSVMQKWLPASDALLEMMIFHLPSPQTAQGYRVFNLYSGSSEDVYAASMGLCNPDAPLMLYVTKMIPTPDKRRFFAVGRVFGGKITTGMNVRVMGPKYDPLSKNKHVYSAKVQKLVVLVGKQQVTVNDVPCGNTVCIFGLDEVITKNATLTNTKCELACTIRGMKFSVSPIVRVAVKPMDPSNLPKLVDGIKRLVKSDPIVASTVEESGQHVIKCAGEHNLAICLKDLQDFTGGAEIIHSDPVVSFRETVIERSYRTVMSRTPNKRNRLYMEARALEDGLAEAIEDGSIDPSGDPKDNARHLTENFGWDMELARKIWSFGPATSGPNLLVDRCRGVQYLNTIREPIISGFQEATKEGALCGEIMRGVCFEIHDVCLDSDAINRVGGQIIPTAGRVMRASQLTASPRLMEPMYMVEINSTEQSLGAIYSVLNKRRAKVFDIIPKQGASHTIKAHLPVLESFGLSRQLSAETSARVISDCVVDHWQLMPSDPLEAGSESAALVAEIRKSKGLKLQMPKLSEYED